MGWLESGGCFGTRCGKASKEGRRKPVCVSEGGAKDRKVGEGAARCWTQLDWESREGPELRFQGRGGMRERPTTRTWSWLWQEVDASAEMEGLQPWSPRELHGRPPEVFGPMARPAYSSHL